MNKKQAFIFILLVLVLLVFNLIFKTLFISSQKRMVSAENIINGEHITSQKLFEKGWAIIKSEYYDYTLNQQNWARWKDHYRGKIQTDEDAYVAINTMLESLNDPYSKYLSKKEFLEQTSSIDSKITGIGVNISSKSGKIIIVNVVQGSPAEFAQLKPKDVILSVDGKDVNGSTTAEVADLVRGSVNSVVQLTILRDNEKITKKIRRKEINIKSIKANVENNIGYIRIMSFIGVTTPNEFVEALEKTQDTDGLILDLRGNTGGLLPNAVFVANMFISQGNIVSIVGRHGYKRTIAAQKINFSVDKPTVVLIDQISASASEILSGALKDYNKAKLVGVKSFGKGMVQKVIPMQNETGLNLTIAKYLTPNGTDINNKGIEPDVEVLLSKEDIENERDTQLEQARNVLKEMMVKK